MKQSNIKKLSRTARVLKSGFEIVFGKNTEFVNCMTSEVVIIFLALY